MKYQIVRGTRDIFGKLAENFEFIENISKKIFSSFGYEEMRTPAFERAEVFTRSLGEGTDIVSKEMYAFKDKGDRLLALRPEETASVVRAAIEHNLLQQGKEQKFYYMGPMFRYDRPQTGRYRQFYQIGAEVFGVNDPFIDMEIIRIAVMILLKTSIPDFKVHINTVGCNSCRQEYTDILKKFLLLKNKELCSTCQERMENNPLRTLDCKEKHCKLIMRQAPMILDHICINCKDDFEKLKTHLDSVSIKYIVDSSLVRGLDYYTGNVFEIKTDMLGPQQDALAAGGRYDNLVNSMGGGKIPAVGFALGEDRVVEVMLKCESTIPKKKKIFFVTTIEDAAIQISGVMGTIDTLRNNGCIVRYTHGKRSVKSQMRFAHDWGADNVVFIEENGMFSIKHMETGQQKTLGEKELISVFVPWKK